ncbi:hypothetical protein KCP74_03935 [Salmonella enterica subsp. enterica]|nr:hypothetical protein KCP74_03935 [Salmonella enterica subsp. enterica]
MEQMVQRLEAARELGLVLRYGAFRRHGSMRVGVEAVRPEHPLAALLPCDNVFAIESRWYRDNPPASVAAGRGVTAGHQSDINRPRSCCNKGSSQRSAGLRQLPHQYVMQSIS